MCDELPRGDLRQEISADQMSYHHDDLMVGLGENRKKMVTEIWVQNCEVKTRMSSLSFSGHTLQRQGLQPEIGDLKKLDYILGCWLTVFESNSPSCVSLRDSVHFLLFFKRGGRTL